MGIVLITKELRKQLKKKERAINRDLKKYGFSISDLLPNKDRYVFTIWPSDGSLRLTKEQQVQLRDVLRKHLGMSRKGGAR